MPSLREKVTINSSEVKDTVNMLIDKATSKANLAQLYPGKTIVQHRLQCTNTMYTRMGGLHLKLMQLHCSNILLLYNTYI
jgi:hypothetical protein